jgi:hypothetical protein
MNGFNGGHQFTGGAAVNMLIVLGIFVAIAMRIDAIVDFIWRHM